MKIRLFFDCDCTTYWDSTQVSSRKKLKKYKIQLKQQVISQLKNCSMVKYPHERVEFKFFAKKEYPLNNYAMIISWVIECLVFCGVLMDNAYGVMDEIVIKQEIVDKYEKEGCVIDVQEQIRGKENSLL